MATKNTRSVAILLLITLAIALVVVWPLLTAILGGAILSYIFYPLHKRLKRAIKHESVSAFLIVIFIILLLVLPSYFVVNAFSHELLDGYRLVRQEIVSGGAAQCESLSPACLAGSALDALELDPRERILVENNLDKAALLAFTATSDFLLRLPTLLLHIFVSFFVTYYLLKDGPRIVRRIKYVLPFRKHHQEELAERFNDVTYAVVFGNLIIALIQGVLAAIGFFVVGIDSPILWGVVTIFTALIPFLGAFIVWFPLALIMLITSYITGDTGNMVRAIGLMVYGFVIISSVDNIFKPKLIGSTAKVHPVLILLGVIGGLAAFGLIGIVLGPVLLSLADTALDMLGREKRASRQK